MAEEPEPGLGKSSERRERLSRASLGLTRSANVVPPDVAPGAAEPDTGDRPGSFMTYLCLPWSYGDRNAGEARHRLQCRMGHHDIAGGHTMHLDGDVVFVERRCRWCGGGPAPPTIR